LAAFRSMVSGRHLLARSDSARGDTDDGDSACLLRGDGPIRRSRLSVPDEGRGAFGVSHRAH
jgi:hypothetical protein